MINSANTITAGANSRLLKAIGIGESNSLLNCLVPLLDAVGWRGRQNQIIEALPHFPEQIGLTEFLNTMGNLQYESQSLSATLDSIDSRLLPCLFVPEDYDPLVLINLKDNQAMAFNGRTGNYEQIPVSHLRGTMYFFKPLTAERASFMAEQPDWFSKVMQRFRSLFATVLVLTFFITVLSAISPLFIMAIYNQLSLSGSIKGLIHLALGVGVFVAGDIVLRGLRHRILSFISVRTGYLVGNEVLRRLLALPSSHTESATLGAQVARIRDFENVREFFSGPAIIALIDLPFITLLIFVLIYLSGWGAVIPVVAILLYIILGLILIPRIKDANQQASKNHSQRQEFLVEMLTNIRSIRVSGASSRWLERFRPLAAETAMSNYRADVTSAAVAGLSQGIVSLAALSTMAFGVWLVIQGHMTLGALMASMLIVWRILAPLKSGFSVITQANKILKSISQVNRLMNIKQETTPGATTSMVRDIGGRVAFSQVGIRYSPDAHPALVGVDFSAEAGEKVVIVGHDGAGKSTLLKLTLKLYQPQTGKILIDSMNLRQMSPQALRQMISYSPQNNHFFYGTIAQNLRLANPMATKADLERAAKHALVLDEIEALPEMFDTHLGDHSSARFSASFLRRLSIARAFVRETRIIILDEPEKGFEGNEMKAFSAMLKNMPGKPTVLIATHSAHFFDIADQVIWLEQGRVRAKGPADRVGFEYNQQNQASKTTGNRG
ncbi:peptidase domain-containing ABC transporter [Desulfurispira natronophila]|uniref:ATP-binding cassette subfamily C protein/ATP-binding cassette subfamily C protein LapB n=1 Tax=Desulfurispira natronophila TaxID=682562 RepID=A0A7W7Y5W3_9BACT|nr:ATP-binding cassette domain-containing protein [Desulfurispira natronophila]MBB5022494.1 ATP-binding cassette subfamily C protein/ATP-binding cassette subfamily C protein LapB [Desulfurispira natronophila]